MRRLAAAALLVLAAVLMGGASNPTPPATRTLTIGVFPAPPFSMKTPQGTWEGMSVDLWRALARDLGVKFEIREVEPDAALTAVAGGVIDVLVSPLVPQDELEIAPGLGQDAGDRRAKVPLPVVEGRDEGDGRREAHAVGPRQLHVAATYSMGHRPGQLAGPPPGLVATRR